MEWRTNAQNKIGINKWKINLVPAIFSVLLLGIYLLMKYEAGWWAPWALMLLTFLAFATWYRRDVVAVLVRISPKGKIFKKG